MIHDHAEARPRRVVPVKALDRILLGLLSESRESATASWANLEEPVQAAVLARARAHNAAVMLAWGLEGACGRSEFVRTELMRARIVSTARDMQLASATCAIVSALLGDGVEAIAYKGAALRRALRLATPTRISADLDVLIKPNDLGKANMTLEGLGYRVAAINPYEIAYVAQRRPPVDLHLSLLTVGGWADRVAPLLRETWHDACSVEIGEVSVPVLSPSHTVMALALHAGCHHMCADWCSLREVSYCTVAWEDKIDWESILRCADLIGFHGALYYVFELAARHFGARVPLEALRRLRPPSYRKPAYAIACAGFGGRLSTPTKRRLSRLAWNLFLTPSVRSAIHWALRRAHHGLGHGRLPDSVLRSRGLNSPPAQATDLKADRAARRRQVD
jgi:hypothetical protein